MILSIRGVYGQCAKMRVNSTAVIEDLGDCYPQPLIAWALEVT